MTSITDTLSQESCIKVGHLTPRSQKIQKAHLVCEKHPSAFVEHAYIGHQRLESPSNSLIGFEVVMQCSQCGEQRRWGLDAT